jgi:6-phosphogluconate dehydrogenase
MQTEQYTIGMIGLGTMGCNLVLNMADNGIAVAGYDRDPLKPAQLEQAGNGKKVKGFTELAAFVNSLAVPRVIIMLVPAGKPVDAVVEELLPLVQPGDIIIDSGNSHYTDTALRATALQQKGYHFFGMGISGGETGARKGPSLMPGGDVEAYKYVKPVLEAIAAKVNGEPCVTYIGPGASGHFVKMVHNGIEYAMMQLIADTYEILKKGLQFDNSQIHQLFKQWNEGRLQSFLLEITSDIFLYKENGEDHLLLDSIKDQARSKGTGKWTSQVSMDLEVAIPGIDMAVAMRDLSKYKSLRTAMAGIYNEQPAKIQADDTFMKQLEESFYFSMIMIYAQGLHLLAKASVDFSYNLNLEKISSIWRGGCIIRAAFLEIICNAFKKDAALQHLLLDGEVAGIINQTVPGTRKTISRLIAAGISIPAYSTSLNYFEALRSEQMPSNLIQAQRDYFGAHTFELIGKEGFFHNDWIVEAKP